MPAINRSLDSYKVARSGGGEVVRRTIDDQKARLVVLYYDLPMGYAAVDGESGLNVKSEPRVLV